MAITKANSFLRPIRVEGEIAYVPLPNGLEAIVDAGDSTSVGAMNWYCFTNGRTRYAATAHKQNLLHRFIMRVGPRVVVDHINGDGLDNRRSNLRLATAAENQRNARRRSDNTSGFKGVSPRGRRWVAGIKLGSKRKHLGSFPTAEEAHAAYVQAARDHFGEFARVE